MNKYPSVAIPSTKKISELYEKIKNESLDVRPDFQRRLVWNVKHKLEFIDTILKGYPFPEIYIANAEVDTVEIQSMELVVDGQQRLTTIVQYIDGDLLPKNESPISSFSNLNKDQKKQFLNYPVTVRDFRDVDQSTIREVFRRINLTQYSLNAFEIDHALYDGEFISLAKELSESALFLTLPTFREKDLSRMLDLGFILLIMATIENQGYFSNDKEVDRYTKEYNNEYLNKNLLRKKLIRTLNVINKYKLTDDSMWFRKSNLFTLIIELSKLSSIPKKADLDAFEGNIVKVRNGNINNPDFVEYYSYMFTGTNSRQARVGRSKLFRKYILEDKTKGL